MAKSFFLYGKNIDINSSKKIVGTSMGCNGIKLSRPCSAEFFLNKTASSYLQYESVECSQHCCTQRVEEFTLFYYTSCYNSSGNIFDKNNI